MPEKGSYFFDVDVYFVVDNDEVVRANRFDVLQNFIETSTADVVANDACHAEQFEVLVNFLADGLVLTSIRDLIVIGCSVRTEMTGVSVTDAFESFFDGTVQRTILVVETSGITGGSLRPNVNVIDVWVLKVCIIFLVVQDLSGCR